MGLDVGERPTIWQVYARRTKGEKRKGELARGVTELPKA